MIKTVVLKLKELAKSFNAWKTVKLAGGFVTNVSVAELGQATAERPLIGIEPIIDSDGKSNEFSIEHVGPGVWLVGHKGIRDFYWYGNKLW